MKKLVLKSWSDSNMAGDGWTWFITLTIRKDGTYSVGATQTSIDEPTYMLPSIYPLRRGRQVREALEQVFAHDALLGNDEIDWEEIDHVISQHLPKLASEIKETFAEDIRFEEQQAQQSLAKALKEQPINDWVKKATWERSKFSHFIAHQMDNHRRRERVFTYAQNYFSKHGRFPTGTHVLGEDLKVQFPES
jgi:RecG-like helicase